MKIHTVSEWEKDYEEQLRRDRETVERLNYGRSLRLPRWLVNLAKFVLIMILLYLLIAGWLSL